MRISSGPFTLQRVHREEGVKFSQPLIGASRKVQARRIRPIDDIDVVVARHHQDPFRKPGVGPQCFVKLGPFGRATCIRHITGDQDEVEDRHHGWHSAEPVPF